jgi:hypothetical protein
MMSKDKPKKYWMWACSYCNGTGQEIAKFYDKQYRIFISEQSDGYWHDERFPTEKLAKKAAKKIKKGPFGSSFMVTVIAPDGEIVYNK